MRCRLLPLRRASDLCEFYPVVYTRICVYNSCSCIAAIEAIDLGGPNSQVLLRKFESKPNVRLQYVCITKFCYMYLTLI